MAHHGERSRWLLQRLDLIAQRREGRRRAQQEGQRDPAYESRPLPDRPHRGDDAGP